MVAVAVTPTGSSVAPAVGGALDVGLFADLGDVSVPSAITIIQTSGHTLSGVGPARYVETESTGETAYRTQTRNGRWFELAETVPDVRMFGAIGDGDSAAEDTAAFDAARAYQTERFAQPSGEPNAFVINGPKIRLPSGSYIYNGAGLTNGGSQSNIFAFEGDGSETTRITLASGVFLINQVASVRFLLRGVQVVGGAGVVRFSTTGTSVGGFCVIEDVVALDYTVCAIGSNSQDFPYLRIRDCVFRGDENSNPIGVALSGYTAGGEITGCDFQRNRYHVKLAPVAVSGTDKGPASPFTIERNSFFRWTNGPTTTHDIWIVPNAETSDNAGRGLAILANKFGNESLHAGDVRILIADEGTGTDNLDKHHVTTVSSGYLSGITWRDNSVVSQANVSTPFIYSYTPNLYNLYLDDQYDGAPTYFLQYDAALLTGISLGGSQTSSRTNYLSLARYMPGQAGTLAPPLSNAPGTFFLHDPLGYSATRDSAAPGFTAGDWSSYVNLLTPTATSGFTAAGSCTKTNIANAIGSPTEAVEARFQALGSSARLAGALTLANIVPGTLAWIEFDIMRSASLPLTDITLQMIDGSSNIDFRRRLTVPESTTVWTRVRFPWVPRYNSGVSSLSVRFIADGYSAGVAEYVKLGRVAVYHSKEPVAQGHLRSLSSTWDNQHMLLGSEHLWVNSVARLRHKTGAPTADTEGNQLVERTTVPATASSTGVSGDIAFDGSYAYFCVSANTWVRAAVATW